MLFKTLCCFFPRKQSIWYKKNTISILHDLVVNLVYLVEDGLRKGYLHGFGLFCLQGLYHLIVTYTSIVKIGMYKLF